MPEPTDKRGIEFRNTLREIVKLTPKSIAADEKYEE